MQVLIRTDSQIDGSERFASWVELEVEQMLSHFASSITKVEVHLKDERGGGTDGSDIACVMEARAAGLEPLVASGHAATPGEAVKDTATKLKRALESKIGKLRDHKG
jgi:ribosome-associated translation inhibitor RaiA